MSRLLILLLVLGLVAAPSALAAAPAGTMTSTMADNPAQTAQALSLQALALLAAGREHETALQKLDQALASRDKENLNVQALRSAHAALHLEDVAQARRLLEQAFPSNDSHIVGITYRSRLGAPQLVAGIAGALALLAGAAGLVRRRRLERAVAPSASRTQTG